MLSTNVKTIRNLKSLTSNSAIRLFQLPIILGLGAT